MRYNNLPEQCKTCQNLKVWALDMGGNHGVACKKGSWNFKKHPLIRNTKTVADAFAEWEKEAAERFYSVTKPQTEQKLATLQTSINMVNDSIDRVQSAIHRLRLSK